MKRSKCNANSAVILLANGYDEKFVNHCVRDFREAKIRTYLLGRSRTATSWHGVEVHTDAQLREFSAVDKTLLVVVPGQPECVSNLALEPKVSEIVHKVLSKDGWLAVAHSAEAALERQKQELPPNMHILPDDLGTDHYFLQGKQDDHEFIRSLIHQLQ